MFQVNVASGELCEQATDVELSGPLPVEWARRYATSDRGRSGRLGFGWTDLFSKTLQLRDGRLAYSAGGEGEVVFAPIQTGQVAVDERRGWTLEWSGGRPVLSNPGFRFVFTPHPLEAFRFLLFETRNYLDEAIRCEYDNDGRLRELIDADGRRLQFYSDVQGRIQGISASLNPGEPSVWLALYEYDRHGDLVRHTNGEGDVTEYRSEERRVGKEC
jgi:YD repeat-containing protein